MVLPQEGVEGIDMFEAATPLRSGPVQRPITSA